jgi:hypothetical protein
MIGYAPRSGAPDASCCSTASRSYREVGSPGRYTGWDSRRVGPPRPAGYKTVLRVLHVLEHGLTQGNSQDQEGHPDGWPVPGVLPSLTPCPRVPGQGESGCNTSGAALPELVLQRFSSPCGPAVL